MDKLENYCFEEHRHRYACWTAARAVQRSFAKTSLICAAINQTSIREYAAHTSLESQDSFDRLHQDWCTTIIDFFNVAKIPCSFGRAAKIVAIYLKTAVVIPSEGKGEKAAVVYPPIDRILLTAIAAKYKDAELISKPWTQFDGPAYQQIRQKILALTGHFNWKTEAYWTVSDEEAGKGDLKPIGDIAESVGS